MSTLAYSSFEIPPAQPDGLEEILDSMRGNDIIDLTNRFIGDQGCPYVAEFIL